MKKFLFAVALICAVTTINAQKKMFQYGLKGGLNFTTYSSDADDVQAHMGQWGALCRFNIGESLSIQPEIFYARQGVRSMECIKDDHPGKAFATNEENESEIFKLGLLSDNIQLPIMVKYYLPIQSIEGINIQAGPQFSQRFDYKISTPSQKGYLADPYLGTPMKMMNIARDMNQFTVMANFGLGYDSKSGIGVDLRYTLGITPVFKNLYNTNARDRIISISFTYVF